MYLFEDLMLDNFPNHKIYYFPNLFRVDDARMAILKKKVFCDGHVVIWGPGSGISDGDKIGPEPAEKLTGFHFTMIPANAPRRILISNFDHPITQNLDSDTVIGGFDIKAGQGGINSISALVRFGILTQLHDAERLANNIETMSLLHALAGVGFLSRPEHQVLQEAYLRYRSRVHRLDLQEEPCVVPSDEFAGLRGKVSAVCEKRLD